MLLYSIHCILVTVINFRKKPGTVYVYATVGYFVHVEFFLFFHSIDLVY